VKGKAEMDGLFWVGSGPLTGQCRTFLQWLDQFFYWKEMEGVRLLPFQKTIVQMQARHDREAQHQLSMIRKTKQAKFEKTLNRSFSYTSCGISGDKQTPRAPKYGSLDVPRSGQRPRAHSGCQFCRHLVVHVGKDCPYCGQSFERLLEQQQHSQSSTDILSLVELCVFGRGGPKYHVVISDQEKQVMEKSSTSSVANPCKTMRKIRKQVKKRDRKMKTCRSNVRVVRTMLAAECKLLSSTDIIAHQAQYEEKKNVHRHLSYILDDECVRLKALVTEKSVYTDVFHLSSQVEVKYNKSTSARVDIYFRYDGVNEYNFQICVKSVMELQYGVLEHQGHFLKFLSSRYGIKCHLRRGSMHFSSTGIPPSTCNAYQHMEVLERSSPKGDVLSFHIKPIGFVTLDGHVVFRVRLQDV